MRPRLWVKAGDGGGGPWSELRQFCINVFVLSNMVPFANLIVHIELHILRQRFKFLSVFRIYGDYGGHGCIVEGIWHPLQHASRGHVYGSPTGRSNGHLIVHLQSARGQTRSWMLACLRQSTRSSSTLPIFRCSWLFRCRAYAMYAYFVNVIFHIFNYRLGWRSSRKWLTQGCSVRASLSTHRV